MGRAQPRLAGAAIVPLPDAGGADTTMTVPDPLLAAKCIES
jgi:hypothetical protein